MSRQGVWRRRARLYPGRVDGRYHYHGHSVRDSQLYLVRRHREPPGGLGDQPARGRPAAGAYQGDQQAWPQTVTLTGGSSKYTMVGGAGTLDLDEDPADEDDGR